MVLGPVDLSARKSGTYVTDHVDLYRSMVRVRAFERSLRALAPRGFVHSSLGQEPVAACVAAVVGRAERSHWSVFGSHRSHALALALGVPPVQLLDEILGLPTGMAGGRGGSMNLYRNGEGPRLVCSARVGGAAGLAVGAALAGSPSIAVLGDGGAQTGVYAEAFVMAMELGLPVVFIVEANGYAISHRPVRMLKELWVQQWDGRSGCPVDTLAGLVRTACARIEGSEAVGSLSAALEPILAHIPRIGGHYLHERRDYPGPARDVEPPPIRWGGSSAAPAVDLGDIQAAFQARAGWRDRPVARRGMS